MTRQSIGINRNHCDIKCIISVGALLMYYLTVLQHYINWWTALNHFVGVIK